MGGKSLLVVEFQMISPRNEKTDVSLQLFCAPVIFSLLFWFEEKGSFSESLTELMFSQTHMF
jgi:hypothetical protein